MRQLLFTFIIGLSLPAFAQESPDTAIKQVVLRLFTAMQHGDTLAARNCFDSSAHLHTALRNPVSGKTRLETETLDAFIAQIAAIRKRNLQIEERIVNWHIQTDLPMAAVWADYAFYVNGKLSHTGVDAFQLFYSADGWKIIQICDTRKK